MRLPTINGKEKLDQRTKNVDDLRQTNVPNVLSAPTAHQKNTGKIDIYLFPFFDTFFMNSILFRMKQGNMYKVFVPFS